MEFYRELTDLTGRVLDATGVFVTVLGALIASVRFAASTKIGGIDHYQIYRQDPGRGILLGLEFLIAGDIIRTVVVAPTLANVFILALIVLIRTFLSIALQLEVEGRWPWQRTAERGPCTINSCRVNVFDDSLHGAIGRADGCPMRPR